MNSLSRCAQRLAQTLSVAVVLLGLAACGGIDDQRALQSVSDHQRQWRSQGPRNYDFTLKRYGMLSGGEIQIQVRDGRIRQALDKAKTPIEDPELMAQLPIIDDLYDEMQADLGGNKGRCKTEKLEFSERHVPEEFKMNCGIETLGFTVARYRRL